MQNLAPESREALVRVDGGRFYLPATLTSGLQAPPVTLSTNGMGVELTRRIGRFSEGESAIRTPCPHPRLQHGGGSVIE